MALHVDLVQKDKELFDKQKPAAAEFLSSAVAAAKGIKEETDEGIRLLREEYE